MFLWHQKIARTAQSVFLLPACIRIMNPPNPLRAVYFSTEKYKYDPSRKPTEVSASQTSQQGSLLLIAERKSQPGRSAHAALDAEEGGKERRRQGGGKWKRGGFFFSASDRSCSQMGGTGPTEGRLHQWRIEQAAAGGEARFVGILICALQKLLRCLHFCSMWAAASAQTSWNETRIPPVLRAKSSDMHSVILIRTVLERRRTRKSTIDLHASQKIHMKFQCNRIFRGNIALPLARKTTKVLWHTLGSITGAVHVWSFLWK